MTKYKVMVNLLSGFVACKHYETNDSGHLIGENERTMHPTRIQELVSIGWLEEIKEPREWYLTIYKEGVGTIHRNYERAGCVVREGGEIVKVKEVL